MTAGLVRYVRAEAEIGARVTASPGSPAPTAVAPMAASRSRCGWASNARAAAATRFGRGEESWSRVSAQLKPRSLARRSPWFSAVARPRFSPLVMTSTRSRNVGSSPAGSSPGQDPLSTTTIALTWSSSAAMPSLKSGSGWNVTMTAATDPGPGAGIADTCSYWSMAPSLPCSDASRRPGRSWDGRRGGVTASVSASPGPLRPDAGP